MSTSLLIRQDVAEAWKDFLKKHKITVQPNYLGPDFNGHSLDCWLFVYCHQTGEWLYHRDWNIRDYRTEDGTLLRVHFEEIGLGTRISDLTWLE